MDHVMPRLSTLRGPEMVAGARPHEAWTFQDMLTTMHRLALTASAYWAEQKARRQFGPGRSEPLYSLVRSFNQPRIGVD